MLWLYYSLQTRGLLSIPMRKKIGANLLIGILKCVCGFVLRIFLFFFFSQIVMIYNYLFFFNFLISNFFVYFYTSLLLIPIFKNVKKVIERTILGFIFRIEIEFGLYQFPYLITHNFSKQSSTESDMFYSKLSHHHSFYF